MQEITLQISDKVAATILEICSRNEIAGPGKIKKWIKSLVVSRVMAERKSKATQFFEEVVDGDIN